MTYLSHRFVAMTIVNCLKKASLVSSRLSADCSNINVHSRIYWNQDGLKCNYLYQMLYSKWFRSVSTVPSFLHWNKNIILRWRSTYIHKTNISSLISPKTLISFKDLTIWPISFSCITTPKVMSQIIIPLIKLSENVNDYSHRLSFIYKIHIRPVFHFTKTWGYSKVLDITKHFNLILL